LPLSLRINIGDASEVADLRGYVKYRSLGRTGWNISEIAFGAWQIGGDWGPVDDRQSIDTLLYAFEKGVNFVDTAELYGKGRSETVIGRALKQWGGSKIYVATKVQPIRWPNPDDDSPEMRGRYPRWYLRDSIEQSLKHLGVERLDLLQLHSWMNDGLASLDWLETLNDMRIEGKIDKIGVSLRDCRPEEGVHLARFGLVDTIQVIYNLFEQRPREFLFPAGEPTLTGFIARVPLDSGSLIGNWTAATYAGWAPGSVPHQMFRGERFGETLARMETLKRLCTRYYATLAEAAMRYVLSSPQVSAMIPGMKSRAEVDMNVAYSDGAAFPRELLGLLAPHAWVRNYYH
jgi:aryl-alcohol dehydrogenase-like predicted oxidoreductase